LEYLAWEGAEKVLYRLERRENGVVKATRCDALRRTGGKEAGDEEWDNGRVLDY
jgi:predicted DNA repair protein MutK